MTETDIMALIGGIIGHVLSPIVFFLAVLFLAFMFLLVGGYLKGDPVFGSLLKFGCVLKRYI